MEKETDLIVFFDTVGRTVLGERVNAETTEEILAIKNPAVVHIMPNQQTGQLSLQILPLFFKEFLADKTDSTVWHYNKKNITLSKDIVFDFKLSAQYQQLFSGLVLPQTGVAPAQQKTEVVKLFDE